MHYTHATQILLLVATLMAKPLGRYTLLISQKVKIILCYDKTQEVPFSFAMN